MSLYNPKRLLSLLLFSSLLSSGQAYPAATNPYAPSAGPEGEPSLDVDIDGPGFLNGSIELYPDGTAKLSGPFGKKMTGSFHTFSVEEKWGTPDGGFAWVTIVIYVIELPTTDDGRKQSARAEAFDSGKIIISADIPDWGVKKARASGAFKEIKDDGTYVAKAKGPLGSYTLEAKFGQ